jgi:hypothetical protein
VTGLARLGSFFDWGFWLWVPIGAGLAFGFLSFIGFVTFVPALILGVFMWRRPRLRRSAYGIIAGVGVPLIAIAYINREGPGTVCHTIDRTMGTKCEELADPRKWLAAGILFVAAGLVAQAWRSREA